MCRILARRHTCQHITKHRLSRCAATFTKPGRRGQITAASCSCEAYICVRSSVPCGPCQYADFERVWADRIEEARAKHKACVPRGPRQIYNVDGSSDGSGYDGGAAGEVDASSGWGEAIDAFARHVDELESLYASETWSIRQSFPTVKRERYEYPQPSLRCRRQGSILRREIEVEDIYCEADVGVDDGWNNTGLNTDRGNRGNRGYEVDDLVDPTEEAVYWDHERWMWVKEESTNLPNP